MQKLPEKFEMILQASQRITNEYNSGPNVFTSAKEMPNIRRNITVPNLKLLKIKASEMLTLLWKSWTILLYTIVYGAPISKKEYYDVVGVFRYCFKDIYGPGKARIYFHIVADHGYDLFELYGPLWFLSQQVSKQVTKRTLVRLYCTRIWEEGLLEMKFTLQQ